MPKFSSPRKIPLILVIGLLVAVWLLILSSGWISRFLTDWMWFDSEEFGVVFRRVILIRWGVGASMGLLSFLILYGNAHWGINHSQEPALVLPAEMTQGTFGRIVSRFSMRRFVFFFCALVAVALGWAASEWWEDFTLFHYGGDFGFEDPLFRKDASFYVFALPVLDHLRHLAWGLVIVSALLSFGIYLARGAFVIPLVEIEGRLFPRGVRIAPAARWHLTLHGSCVLILLAVGFYLGRFDLLYERKPTFTGPGYAEVFGTLPLLTIEALTLLAASVVLIVAVERARWRWLVIMGILVLISHGLTTIYPLLLQRFSVLPNELNYERDYIGHHIKATRWAFGLEKMEERSLAGDDRLTQADVEANRATINNVRLWDHEPLRQTFSQVQEIRTYYDFPAVDNDRYVINGELRQTMLSARELLTANLPNRTWVNEKLIYTHGYGVALGPVNQVTSEGLPELFIQDLPPKWRYPELKIERPEIYFGESSRSYVFVKTKTKEFDYPSGNENVSRYYDRNCVVVDPGNSPLKPGQIVSETQALETQKSAGGQFKFKPRGGVGIGSLLKRLLFAVRLTDIKILLSSDFTSESRILLSRNIRERADRVAPFLAYDEDPYLVIHEGRLLWIRDGYTLSDRFPYSQRFGRIGNYLRNSVKVVMDAYDGSMTFYVADPSDPIIQAWSRAFPGMFHALKEMPTELRAHLRHPEDFFAIQARVFATYHMEDPQVFYNREDEWEIPRIDGKKGKTEMTPYYTIMKLPGEEKEEFILMLPFTPRGKDNLSAWMAARSDGENYGRLVVYRFPKGKLVFGPNNLVARVNQDETISPQLTLWGQQGSEAHLGTLLVIPIKESLIYVQPLYLRASSGSIPELKRVIVGYESQIVMEPTLELALERIFSAKNIPSVSSPNPTPSLSHTPSPTASNLADLISSAKASYEAAEKAAREGDWARYGEEMKRLGAALEALSRVKSEQK